MKKEILATTFNVGQFEVGKETTLHTYDDGVYTMRETRVVEKIEHDDIARVYRVSLSDSIKTELFPED